MRPHLRRTSNLADGRRDAGRRRSKAYATARDVDDDVKRLHECIAERRGVLRAAILNGETVLAVAVTVVQIRVERRRLDRHVRLAAR